MRVAFFTPTRDDCGIADYARHLLRHLRPPLDINVVPAERLESVSSYGELGRAMSAADVAHIQYEHGFFRRNDAPAANFDAFLSAIHVPKVVTLHCLPLEDAHWQRHLVDPSLSFLVHSRHHREILRARGARGMIEVTPHPAPPRTARRVSPSAYRSARGLDGKIVLTIFGFTKPHKGYELALDALGRLPERTVLLIAGGAQDDVDRSYRSNLLRQARERRLESRVVVSGYVPAPEVGAALGASDLVLAPFRSMTASGSIATALAWERPVVAARLEQNAELQAAFGCLALFDTGDATDLARQIDHVLTDTALRQSLIDGAHRFRTRCTYRALAARTRRMWEHVVAGSPPPRGDS
jgi:glycosyltransferase involved in cell wall biosynthesis